MNLPLTSENSSLEQLIGRIGSYQRLVGRSRGWLAFLLALVVSTTLWRSS
jgi:hypothetical protein